MPIYEYGCDKCDHRLDALQKISDAPLMDCPECNEPALRKLLSAPRFRLKGDGWYETDFKKDNQKNVHKSDSEPTKKKEKDGELKSADVKESPKKPESKVVSEAGSE